MPGAVALKFFEAVAGWVCEVAVFAGGMKHQEFAFGLASKGAKLTGGLTVDVEGSCVFAGEGFDHDSTRYVSWIGRGVNSEFEVWLSGGAGRVWRFGWVVTQPTLNQRSSRLHRMKVRKLSWE